MGGRLTNVPAYEPLGSQPAETTLRPRSPCDQYCDCDSVPARGTIPLLCRTEICMSRQFWQLHRTQSSDARIFSVSIDHPAERKVSGVQVRRDQHRYNERVQYSIMRRRLAVPLLESLNGFPIPTANESMPMAHLFSNRLSGCEVADDLHGLTTLTPGIKFSAWLAVEKESVLCFWLEDQLEKRQEKQTPTSRL
jgi:hypothetical protein